MKTNQVLANLLRKKMRALAVELTEELQASGDWSPNTRRVYISLALPPARGQDRVLVRVVSRTERTVRGSPELAESDWHFIIHLPWTDPQRRVIEKLREQNNAPLHWEEIDALLGRDFPYGAETIFNRHFYRARNEGGCYSFLRVGKLRTEEGNMFRIFKMEYKARKPNFK